MNKSLSKLGRPNLQVSGLRIWVNGRVYPANADYWDGNWLNVVFHCFSKDSEIWVTESPDLHGSGFTHLKSGLENIYNTGKGKAELDTIGPHLSVEFKAESTDKIEMKVDITPNQVFEHHQYLFYLDKTDLKSCISQLTEILERYPIVGKPGQ